MFCIWSHEHRAWWRPLRQGYTPHAAEAGRYNEQETAEIVLSHIPPGEEVAVRSSFAEQFQGFLTHQCDVLDGRKDWRDDD